MSCFNFFISIVLSINDPCKIFEASVKVISFGGVVVRLFKYLFVVPSIKSSVVFVVRYSLLLIVYVCPVGILMPDFAFYDLDIKQLPVEL